MKYLDVRPDKPMGDEGMDENVLRNWLVENTDNLSLEERIFEAETNGLASLVKEQGWDRSGEPVVIKFQAGLKPILKHLSGKHDQSSHGRGGGTLPLGGSGGAGASGEFSEWGDRAPELIAARGVGPSRETLEAAIAPKVSRQDVRQSIEETFSYDIETEVETRMADSGFQDASADQRKILREYAYRQAVDRKVDQYGAEARRRLIGRNSDDVDLSAMEDVYSVTHEGVTRNGVSVSLRSEVTTIEMYGSNSFDVVGPILDNNTGRIVGGFKRSFGADQDGNLSVSHELLEITDDYQGSGFAKTFNRQAENFYITRGIEDVYVHAALDGGGYAWASAGFDWDRGNLNQSVNNISRKMDNYLTDKPDIPRTIRADIESTRSRLQSLPVTNRDYPTPKEISDLGRIEGVNNWPGKEIMRGSNWYGKKTLRPEGARVSTSQAAKETERAQQRDVQQKRDREAAARAPGRGQLTMDNNFLDGALQQASAYQTSLIEPIPGMVQ